MSRHLFGRLGAGFDVLQEAGLKQIRGYWSLKIGDSLLFHDRVLCVYLILF